MGEQSTSILMKKGKPSFLPEKPSKMSTGMANDQTLKEVGSGCVSRNIKAGKAIVDHSQQGGLQDTTPTLAQLEQALKSFQNTSVTQSSSPALTSGKIASWSKASLSSTKPFLPGRSNSSQDLTTSPESLPHLLPSEMAFTYDGFHQSTSLDIFRREEQHLQSLKDHSNQLSSTELQPQSTGINGVNVQRSVLPPRMQSLKNRSMDALHFQAFEKEVRASMHSLDVKGAASVGLNDGKELDKHIFQSLGMQQQLKMSSASATSNFSSPSSVQSSYFQPIFAVSSRGEQGPDSPTHFSALINPNILRSSQLSATQSLSGLSSPSDMSRGLSSSKASTSAWVTTSPSTSLASAAHLANLGVGIGPGVNPNVSPGCISSGINGTSTPQSNPPIVNTGNNGPMCVQPGDWVCSSCGFVNWRRRRVCMRCYPFADTNEMSQSIASGAILAAQLAAGIEPTAEAITSLAQPKRSNGNINSEVNGASNGKSSTKSLGSSPFPPTFSSIPSLPPRPETRMIDRRSTMATMGTYPTVNIHSTPDLLQRRMQSSQERFQDKREELEEVMDMSRSLRAGLSFQGGDSSSLTTLHKSPLLTDTSAQDSSTFLSPMINHHISRSPSMPTLVTSEGSARSGLNPGRSIWTSVPSNSAMTSPQPPTLGLDQPFYPSPTYRSYKPTTLFAPYSDPIQTSPTLFGTDKSNVKEIWPQSMAIQSTGSSSSTIGMSFIGSNQDTPLNDQTWLEGLPKTPFSGSSSSTIKASRQSSGSLDAIEKISETVTSAKDLPVTEPRLSKSQAIIQPPPTSTTSTNCSSVSINNGTNCISSISNQGLLPSILFSVSPPKVASQASTAS